jgi:hypothetical protein
MKNQLKIGLFAGPDGKSVNGYQRRGRGTCRKGPAVVKPERISVISLVSPYQHSSVCGRAREVISRDDFPNYQRGEELDTLKKGVTLKIKTVCEAISFLPLVRIYSNYNFRGWCLLIVSLLWAKVFCRSVRR